MNLDPIVQHQKKQSKFNGHDQADDSSFKIETNEKETIQFNEARVHIFLSR